MRNVAIVTDSSATLPADVIEQHQIFVVPQLVHIDGQTYRDGVDMTPSDVYRYMANTSNGQLPTTSAPSTDSLLRAYMQAAQEAENILSIHTSAELSATYQVACLTRDLIDVPVHVLDSQTAAMCCGFAALEAARMAESGPYIGAGDPARPAGSGSIPLPATLGSNGLSPSRRTRAGHRGARWLCAQTLSDHYD